MIIASVFMLIWLVPVLAIPLLNYFLGKSDACHEEFCRITKEEDCCGELERMETGLTEDEWRRRHKCSMAEKLLQDMPYPTCFIPVFGLVMSVALLVFIVQAEIRYLIKKIRRK